MRQLANIPLSIAAIVQSEASRSVADFITGNPKKIERAIADDLAWLAANPTRRSNGEAMARSRVFKVAMRQRIREVAASRNLSDEEITPVLKLKHEAIGGFCELQGVNIGWLLEGVGPVFKSGG
jgi:hypothetical protein